MHRFIFHHASPTTVSHTRDRETECGLEARNEANVWLASVPAILLDAQLVDSSHRQCILILDRLASSLQCAIKLIGFKVKRRKEKELPREGE